MGKGVVRGVVMLYVEAKVGLISPRPYQTTWGWYSRNMSKRSSIRLQNGCREGFGPPNFQLGSQPEMLSPAILKRSTPRIPFSDMGSSLFIHVFPSLQNSVLARQAQQGVVHRLKVRPFFGPRVAML